MSVCTNGKAVEVCTVHRQVRHNGVWSRRQWAETMAARHQLTLQESCCTICLSDAHAIFIWQWRQQ